MPPLIREMLENPEAFEDHAESTEKKAELEEPAPPPALLTMKKEQEDEDDSWATENGSEPSPEEEDDDDDDGGERGTDSDGEAWGGQEPNVDVSRKSHGGRAQWGSFLLPALPVQTLRTQATRSMMKDISESIWGNSHKKTSSQDLSRRTRGKAKDKTAGFSDKITAAFIKLVCFALKRRSQMDLYH